jgi:glycosyltransferase involved in cell wall biosynthesis
MIRYWGVPAEKIEVVYPPVDTHNYSPDDAETEEYYLTLSRLDWHKSVDDIVRAFDGLDAELVVAGDGPERDRLEAMAGPNVRFTGYVDESNKRELLAGAKAFVFNGQDEDFGISPVEALASGTPVLGVEEGMTQYQVVDGKNGYTFQRDEEGETIRDEIREFEETGVDWSDSEIASFADRFSVQAFHERMHGMIEHAVKSAEVTPQWYTEIEDASRL